MKAVRWAHVEGAARKMFLALCWCPDCGGTFSISRKTHAVKDDGSVTPSMICPDCPFHEWVFLERWRAPGEPCPDCIEDVCSNCYMSHFEEKP